MSIAKIAIANRGEIACRIIRTARSLGIGTVALYSEADRNGLHVQQADERVLIGPSPVSKSYLAGQNIIQAAQDAGADAIHPGYGFLSENADFARDVASAGLTFIGAPAAAIHAMGNKAEAKRLMISVGVPCVPGYEGENQSDQALSEAAAKIGFPIMVKAAAGGGGRGMRFVATQNQLLGEIALARSEAQNAFGSGELILERAVQNARHVEVQIFADNHGNCIHLGERDCSIQRRHQKVVEEAPCPIMTPQLRASMTKAAIDAARAVEYRGAGTVEFLLDGSGEFYFLEMNTRLQVEHPVTEMITGLDLVAMQIAVANGDALPLEQEEVRLEGHAIEVRLYAEKPSDNYLPAIGEIAYWEPVSGEGVRTDHGIESGMAVSPFYDPMLGKVIAHGPNRDIARSRLRQALKHTSLLGLPTNRMLLCAILDEPIFANGQATIDFLANTHPHGFGEPPVESMDFKIAAAILYQCDANQSLRDAPPVSRELLGWSSAAPLARPISLNLGDQTKTLEIIDHCGSLSVTDKTDDGNDVTFIKFEAFGDHKSILEVDGQKRRAAFAFGSDCEFYLQLGAKDMCFKRPDPLVLGTENLKDGAVHATMPGSIIDVRVAVGNNVRAGDTLAVIEAMKMQHQIRAVAAGTISKVHVSAGLQIVSGALMFELEIGE